jgi:undecaprenyl-diphosphatase
MDLDTRIFLAVNAFARATPWLHSLVTGYANYGVVLFAALMIAGWWTARATADPAPMAAALWTPLAALLALGINQPIADAVGRTRPCNALHDIVVLHCNTDPGLPSDHAVLAGAATAGLWLVSRRLGTITAIATIAMAFTRIYIGAHYPGDVLAGIGLGAVVALAGYALARPLLQRAITALARTPVRLLVRQGSST